ncbi:DUF5107 domain-containing protein [Niabella drilacis]|uniref:Uncharacterized conserved protein HemY, contains two TPR repeats n=1 Tax=Niabella drilacis (strain DSM 25811 / CCM 8410 / CCUG 62505 / LMG 26954 / E90) TaxID=1285928 RepID=A0A1G6L2Q5_NIADE|nr:DUF5107 domain-containing protein [Niabella drilacis]SDC37600.1 Uncharacterized conserved protein HemY, contains two TPR repeats [Niabella drilacis]
MMEVQAWQEVVKIPTYKTGQPDKNPMFLEKRVYQGSSGVVYPYQVIDKVYDEKEEKEWTALYLENDYLKVMILPELGGRIQMAYDKTNDYHFVYHNRVIKPALVGLLGPWISGGIEFNWPQHHRPTTFDATDFQIVENKDGSKTVWVNEYEQMFGTKCALGFTLYADKAYIELEAKLYNRTPFPQTFLWWANPAVAVDEHYQSVFPPDVNAVFDHGKRDVSSFPIATGTYYKVDYAPGTDISIYTNIPVPTSYMAVNSAFNFVGGYHHQKRAGIMHVANHHVSPGKKQWTWGCGEFGKAWDRQLTDEDGPYFELMCGVYTDNQPDFSWIMPNEVRTFKQYFMPYKNIGYVKNASADAMINLETTDLTARVQVYITKEQPVTIKLKQAGQELFSETVVLSPLESFEKQVSITGAPGSCQLKAEVLDGNGKLLIAYTPVERNTEAIPDPAKPILRPEALSTSEELYLAGLHLEQYRHATYSPLDYYREALVRDATDVRCNNAMGLWYLRRGQFETAEPYLRTAVEKLMAKNPNPYDGEPLYNLGLCLQYQNRLNEAKDWLYKSTWNAAQQDNAYLQLAYISALQNDWEACSGFAEKSVLRNYHSLKARHIKAIALRKLNRDDEAAALLEETLRIDAFDFAARYEWCGYLQQHRGAAAAGEALQQLQRQLRNRSYSFIEMALQYAAAGLYEEAIAFLAMTAAETTDPMVSYYRGYFSHLSGNGERAAEWLRQAFGMKPDGVFPNRIEDIAVLRTAVELNPGDYKAFYYLGNFYYGKRLYEQARTCWEQSLAINPDFATTNRNLGIAYYNKFGKKEAALHLFQKAFDADPSDSRVLFELDQLKKRFNIHPGTRLSYLNQYPGLVRDRDDLYIEYIGLHSLLGRFEEAGRLLSARNFHPWEGGEGKTSGQHVLIHVARAKQSLAKNDLESAGDLLLKARAYPANLGEGKLYGAQENDILYWLGCVAEAGGNRAAAQAYWEKAAVGLSEPAPAIFYNDQQPDQIFYQGMALRKAGRQEEAEQRFRNLIRYGEAHLNDTVAIDFFAVSLPDLMIFDDDLDLRNRIHCYYLMGLGHLGLGAWAEAGQYLGRVLKLDPAHTGATLHRGLIPVL